MATNINKLIIQTASQGLKLIKLNGSVPAGHNGPYKDKETPVRNTSHWLIIFSAAHQLTGSKNFIQAVKKLAGYLTSSQVRPRQASFHHRLSPHKDKCNGLIGQAWTIEALVEASRTLKDNQYSKLATKVFLNHKFNAKIGLWHRLEINGKTLSLDATLNHQIWFAASGSGLQNKTIRSQIKLFLDRLSDNLTVLNNGLIFHPIVSVWKRQTLISRAKNIILGNHHPSKVHKALIYKSIGYHTFNLYALAILKINFPKHKFWQSKPFKLALDYCFSEQYKKDLAGNKYGFPYNPVGFEMPLIIQTFSNLNQRQKTNISRQWIKDQLKYGVKSTDSETIIARTYELARVL